jgi:Protein of unknown function (DUF3298)
MESSPLVARLRLVAPVAAVAALALVAVFVAMTILGSVTPGPTASPSGTVVADVTASPTPEPTPAPPTASPTGTSAPESQAPVPSGPLPTVTSASASAKDPAGIWTVSGRYPRLVAPANPLAATVNQDIADDVQAHMQAFEVGPAAVQQQPGKVNTLTASYKVELLRSDLASFTVTWVEDTSGAHPATTIETLSYDLNKGVRIAFSDVFADSAAALGILSQQSRDLLRPVLGADYDPTIVNDGTSPDCPSLIGPTPSCPLAAGSNFGTWALTSSGFRVIFQEYQVAAYADGTPSVSIPWSALVGVLKSDGPAAPLAH